MAQNEKELMSVSALTRELHMRTVRNLYDQYLEQAKAEKWDYEKFLCSLLQAEYEQRLLNSQQKRLKTAGFRSISISKTLTVTSCPKESSQGLQNWRVLTSCGRDTMWCFMAIRERARHI